jgi:tetratricopeptide (TPR) repeat protein
VNHWNEQLKKHTAVAAWVLILLMVAIFQGVLANGFVYDDERQLVDNPFIRNAHLWHHIFSGSVWSFLGGQGRGNFYRPLQIFAYWLVYRLAGADAPIYHLMGLAFYAGGLALVFRLGCNLLGSDLAAFAGALLWALHPLHVEPVAWIAGTPDLGCGFFYLLAFWLFVRAERAEGHHALRHLLAVLAYFPALFFKETALSFPILLLAYWLYIPSGESWWSPSRLARPVPSRSRLDRWAALVAWYGARWLPYLAAAIVYLGIRIAIMGRFSHARQMGKLGLRVVGAALGLLGQHAKLFFLPVHLNVFRTFDFRESLLSPWPWLTLLAVLGTLWLRKREPSLAFLIIWWLVTLLPVTDYRQLSFPLVAERFSYLPSFGLSMAIAFLGLVGLPRWFRRWDVRPAAVAGVLLLGCFWAFQDIRAIPNWRDNQILYSYSLREAPDAGLVRVHHALVLQFVKGDFDGAAREYESALRLNGASFMPLAGVTYDSYLGLGQLANLRGNRQQAVEYFQKAVRTTPDNSAAFDFLGSVYFPLEDYAQAAEYFQRAVSTNPYDLMARFYLGTCWLKLGKPGQAAQQFHAAREVDPTYAPAYEAEARALEAAGDAAEAARVRSQKPKP